MPRSLHAPLHHPPPAAHCWLKCCPHSNQRLCSPCSASPCSNLFPPPGRVLERLPGTADCRCQNPQPLSLPGVLGGGGVFPCQQCRQQGKSPHADTPHFPVFTHSAAFRFRQRRRLADSCSNISLSLSQGCSLIWWISVEDQSMSSKTSDPSPPY